MFLTASLRLSIVALALTATPVAFGDSRGELLKSNDAYCLTGTCCREAGSICNAGGLDHQDYYYKESGPCN